MEADKSEKSEEQITENHNSKPQLVCKWYNNLFKRSKERGGRFLYIRTKSNTKDNTTTFEPALH